MYAEFQDKLVSWVSLDGVQYGHGWSILHPVRVVLPKSGLQRSICPPFRHWQKKSEKCADHRSSRSHQDSLFRADQFCLRIEHPEKDIAALVNTQFADQVERNRRILLCNVDAIVADNVLRYAGIRRSYGLLAIMDTSSAYLLSRYDTTLQQYQESSSMAGVTYMSPQIENEILEIIGKHITLRGVLDEIKQAQVYSVLADEVVSSNIKHLAICCCSRLHPFCRCWRKHHGRVPHLSATYPHHWKAHRRDHHPVPSGTVNFRRRIFVDKAMIAPHLPSSLAGVQGRSQEVKPLITNIHCSGHCLCLVISHLCCIPEVRNVLDRLKYCCRNFLDS